MTSPDIHPSAVLHPKAALHSSVRVGAFSVIGPDVTIGAGAEIGHHVVLEGRIEIDRDARVGHGSVVGGVPQDLKFKDGTPSGVRIGAQTVIREYVTIHRATRPDGWTDIGDRCLIMAQSHVAHDCRLGDGAILINYTALTGHCEVGALATVGGLTGITPFTRVGALAYVGGMSKVTADVPPYMIATGVPATARAVNVVGLRRAEVPAGERRLLRDAYRILYRSGLAPGRAVERIRDELSPSPTIDELLRFVAAAHHGIVRGSGSEVSDVDADADGEGDVVAPSPPREHVR